MDVASWAQYLAYKTLQRTAFLEILQIKTVWGTQQCLCLIQYLCPVC